nr:MAG TPA: hypothetical protein [Caudoviricetes sp.]
MAQILCTIACVWAVYQLTKEINGYFKDINK